MARKVLTDLRVSGNIYENGQTLDEKFQASGVGGASALNNLTDVSVSSPTSGNQLNYDGSNWIDEPKATGGFASISVTSGVIQTRTIISQGALTADGNIDITDIPQTYDHLELRVRARSNDVGQENDTMEMIFNSDDTDTNYHFAQHYGGYNVSNVDGGQGADTPAVASIPAVDADANVFGIVDIVIPDYSRSDIEKSSRSDIVDIRADNARFHQAFAHHWENTAAITQITLQTNNNPTDLLVSGCTWELVGVKEQTVITSITNAGSVLAVSSGTRLVPDLLLSSGLTSDVANLELTLPGGYEFFELYAMTRTDRAGQSQDTVNIYFNGDNTASNYDNLRLRGRDGSADAADDTDTVSGLNATGDAATAGEFGNNYVRIPFYATDAHKIMWIETHRRGGNDDIELVANQWKSNDVVSGLTLQGANGNLVSGCWFKLVGWKQESLVTDVEGGGPLGLPSPATSGDIAVFNGSSWSALPSCGTVYMVDVPPASPGEIDEEFDPNTSNISGTFAWWDPGSKVSASGIDEAGYWWFHGNSGGAGNSWAGIAQPVPAGSDWTVVAKVSMDIYDDNQTNQVQCAIGCMTSDIIAAPTTADLTALLYDWRLDTNPHLIRLIQANYSSYTTFNSSDDPYHDFNTDGASTDGTAGPTTIYLRVTYNGTNLLWYYSFDGIAWVFLCQQAEYLTPAYVGVFSNHVGSTALSNLVRVHWIRSFASSTTTLRPPLGRRVKVWPG